MAANKSVNSQLKKGNYHLIAGKELGANGADTLVDIVNQQLSSASIAPVAISSVEILASSSSIGMYDSRLGSGTLSPVPHLPDSGHGAGAGPHEAADAAYFKIDCDGEIPNTFSIKNTADDSAVLFIHVLRG